MDEYLNVQRFGRIYGKGLDYTLKQYIYCEQSFTSQFNSIQEKNEVHASDLADIQLRIDQFANLNFAGCDVNSFVI